MAGRRLIFIACRTHRQGNLGPHPHGKKTGTAAAQQRGKGEAKDTVEMGKIVHGLNLIIQIIMASRSATTAILRCAKSLFALAVNQNKFV